MDNARASWKLSTRRMPFARVAVLTHFLWLVASGSVAHAAVEGDEVPCVRADREEDDGAFARALADDRACAEAAAGPSTADRAASRAEWLAARSEGDFGPLARLERVRKDPRRLDDPVEIDALARDLEAFPPGLVRVEARMTVAEAWLGRMRTPARAVGELRAVTLDPHAPAVTARLAERELLDAVAETRGPGAAAAEAHARQDLLDPALLRSIDRVARRGRLHVAAVVVLLAFATLAAFAVVRASIRGSGTRVAHALGSVVPVAVPFVAFMAGAGALLASLYEAGNARPFVYLGAVSLAVVLGARAWGAVGSNRTASRVARAIFCAASVLAAAFIVLDAVNPSYLEGFGL